MYSFIVFKIFYLNLNFSILLIDPAEGLGNRFFIIIIAALIAYFSRFILIRFMNRWMMTKSSKVDKNANPDTPTQELINNKKLSFESFNSDSYLSKITIHRKTLVERTKKMMWLQFFTDILIILVPVVH